MLQASKIMIEPVAYVRKQVFQLLSWVYYHGTMYKVTPCASGWNQVRDETNHGQASQQLTYFMPRASSPKPLV